MREETQRNKRDDVTRGEPNEISSGESGPEETNASGAVPDSTNEEAQVVAEPVQDVLADLKGQTMEVVDRLKATEERLAELETAVGDLSRQVAFVPPQVRLLGSKIEGVATSISEARYKSVLLSLLGIYDLVDQVLRSLPSDADADHRRNYDVLRTQLRQILEMNGLSEISAEGSFDPTIHRAIQRKVVDDPAMADCVLDVIRSGFRTDLAILRYAEVVVGQYQPPETAKEEPPEKSPEETES